MAYHDLLSVDDTNALLSRAQAGDRAAVETILFHNQRLVEQIANRFFIGGYAGDQELCDLCQWGNIGLLRAIEKWDATRGMRFSTYATHWINGVIWRNAVKRGESLGISYRDVIKLSAIRHAQAALYQRIGRMPDEEEIAAETGMPCARVKAMMPALLAHVRLDKECLTPGGEEYDLHELITGDGREEIDDRAEHSAMLVELAEKINQLPERQREVVTRRYLTEPAQSLPRIAKEMEISYQAAQQLEKRALSSLRLTVSLNSDD